MRALPLRLQPGDDLRGALDAALQQHGVQAAFVISGIGSLGAARLRLAGAAQPVALHGELEILSLAGSLSPDGSHLHMAIADAQGQMLGGHVAPGCTVRTTVEVLLAMLPEHRFARERDARTGYAELVVRSQPPR